MDEELTAAGYRRYSGDKIDVYFNSAICRHSAIPPFRQLRAWQRGYFYPEPPPVDYAGQCRRGGGETRYRHLPQRRT